MTATVQATNDNPLVTVKDLGRVFDISKPWLNRVLENEPRKILTAVEDVSFSIPKGQTFALVGESGSGKSTIARMVVGLLRPTSGSVQINGQPFAAADPAQANTGDHGLRRRIQMVFQDPFASLNPRLRVSAIVGEPIAAFGLAQNYREQADRVAHLLEQVGLSAADADRFPHEFSGGQRQRIAVARALASEPDFIVCDEPTSALDVSVQAQVLNLLRELQAKLGLTYLFISHDLSVVRFMADHVGVLYLGRLVEHAPRDELFTEPRHPYTRMLLDAAPRLDAFGRTVDTVMGEIPDPVDRPSGCHFHPRCPIASEHCRCDAPVTQQYGQALVSCHALAKAS